MPTPEELQKIWNEEATATDDTQVAQPVEETPPAAAEEVAEQADAAVEQPAVDPFQQRLDDLEAKISERLRKTEGHIGGLTSELKRTKEMLSAGQASAQATSDAPTDTQMAKAAENPEAWNRLKEDFPEWAAGVESLLTSRMPPVSPTVDQAQIQKLVNEQVQQHTTEIRNDFQKRLAEAQVEAKHEDWRDVISTPDFMAWQDKQPEDVKRLFFSDAPRDAVRMLDLYKASAATSATEVQQTRQSRLAAAATPKGSNVPAQKGPDDMTPQELWDFEARQRQKAN